MGYNLIADLAERHTRVGRCILCGHGPGAATTPWGACKHCAPTPDGDRLLAAVRATDPRDAEIARLKAELEAERFDTRILRRNLDQARDDHDAEATRLRRALAAGPAALRIDARDGIPWGPYKQLPVEEAVATVEAAQAAAMREGT